MPCHWHRLPLQCTYASAHVELVNHAERVHDVPEHLIITPELSVEFPLQEPLENSTLVASWVPVQSAPRHDVAVPAWTVHTRALAAKAKTARVATEVRMDNEEPASQCTQTAVTCSTRTGTAACSGVIVSLWAPTFTARCSHLCRAIVGKRKHCNICPTLALALPVPFTASCDGFMSAWAHLSYRTTRNSK